jgi:predicted RNA-binding protein Jag
MSKNKTAGISEILKEQAKERFNISDNTENKTEVKEIKPLIENSSEKIRKNFYIEKYLTKLLRKMAYEKEMDQTKIVNLALENFFREQGYINQ